MSSLLASNSAGYAKVAFDILFVTNQKKRKIYEIRVEVVEISESIWQAVGTGRAGPTHSTRGL